MTEKQKRFCEEYLIDLNATQAAIRAGYASASSSEQGSRLLRNVQVRARVDAALAARSARTGVNADRVIRELARIAFLNAPDLVNMDDATLLADASREDTAAIASVKVKQMYGDVEGVEREIKFADKLKALELLGKHLGMFSDKLQLSGGIDIHSGKLDAILEQLNE